MSRLEETELIEVQLLLQAIHDRYGYDFRGYAADSMVRRVMAALAKSGMSHLGEVQHRILVDPNFFGSFLQDLTVQVSEMFRDPALYRAFRSQVVPVLRTYPHIKVWHAGCATGEEVYSTAITLLEEGLMPRSQVYATDISTTALDRAREGVYRVPDLAMFERNYYDAGGTATLADYYTLAYGRIALREILRENVVFFQHDLVSDHGLGEMQVIFCRNVLIYFGDDLRHKVTHMLTAGLCRGGFLCLGSSERPPDSPVPLRALVAGQPIYKKVES